MVLNIFFAGKKERMNFLKNHFDIGKLGSGINLQISGVNSIEFKKSFSGIPGHWMELNFYDSDEGIELYERLIKSVDPEKINNNVFYPKKNMKLKELEESWIKKYGLLDKTGEEEKWGVFFLEVKSHLKNCRMDIAFNALIIFLKYNPFFLKKYRRYYMLENLAYYYEEGGNIGKAIKCLKIQAVLNPEAVEPFLNMSSFYIINGMEEEAFHICMEALKKIPDNQYLISNLVIALSNIGNYGYAVEFLKKVIDKHPENSYYWKLMGDILYEIENNKGAIACYKKALKKGKKTMIDEFKADVYSGMAACYSEEGDYSESVKFYNKVLKYIPNDSFTLLSLAQIHFYKLRNLNTALQYTKQLVEKMPENGYGQYQLGLIYNDMGNIDKARWHLYKARRIMPYFQPIHAAISSLKKSQGKLIVF